MSTAQPEQAGAIPGPRPAARATLVAKWGERLMPLRRAVSRVVLVYEERYFRDAAISGFYAALAAQSAKAAESVRGLEERVILRVDVLVEELWRRTESVGGRQATELQRLSARLEEVRADLRQDQESRVPELARLARQMAEVHQLAAEVAEIRLRGTSGGPVDAATPGATNAHGLAARSPLAERSPLVADLARGIRAPASERWEALIKEFHGLGPVVALGCPEFTALARDAGVDAYAVGGDPMPVAPGLAAAPVAPAAGTPATTKPAPGTAKTAAGTAKPAPATTKPAPVTTKAGAGTAKTPAAEAIGAAMEARTTASMATAPSKEQASDGDLVAHLGTLPAGSLGGAFVSLVAHPAAGADLDALLAAAARALREDGVVVLEAANPASFTSFLEHSDVGKPPPRPSPDQLVARVHRSGLEVEECRYSPPPARHLAGVSLDLADPEVREIADGVNALVGQLNDILYGPQDYVAILRKGGQ